MITIHVIHHTIQISHEFVEILRRHPEGVGSLIMASSVLQDMGDPSGMIFRHGEFNGLLMSAILIAGGGATTWVMHEVGNIIKATYFGIGPILNRTYHEIREVQPEIQLPQNVDALIDRVQHFSAATPNMIAQNPFLELAREQERERNAMRLNPNPTGIHPQHRAEPASSSSSAATPSGLNVGPQPLPIPPQSNPRRMTKQQRAETNARVLQQQQTQRELQELCTRAEYEGELGEMPRPRRGQRVPRVQHDWLGEERGRGRIHVPDPVMAYNDVGNDPYLIKSQHNNNIE